jgi:hypothetical protein
MSLRSALIVALALLLCALCAPPASAWGEKGHRITGAIATRFLTDDARTGVADLLGAQTLAQASTWADEIKGDDRYEWARPMHYVNLPRGAVAYAPERDCPDRTCAVSAIEDFAARIRDERRSRAERIEALKFVVHFVGDVHQPLHAAYADDRGGNETEVVFRGESTNLHRLWDDDVIEAAFPADWAETARILADAITPEHAAQWRQQSAPAQWADESFAHTRELVYATDRMVSDAYFRASADVIQARLAMAGVRLADLLNRTFAAAPESGPTESAPPPAPPEADTPKDDGPRAFLAVVFEGRCGDDGGERAFLVNRHAEKTIRAVVRKTWTARGEPAASTETYTVRPGDKARRSLGCSVRAGDRGEVRRFTWMIVSADFR